MSEVLKGLGNIECNRERELALKTFKMLYDGSLTDLAGRFFDVKTADIYFNTGSGNVFLSDEDFNVIMDNGEGKLDLFISLSYNGHEGFLEDLLFDLENGNVGEEDLGQLYNYLNEKQKKKYKKYFKNIEK